MQHSYFPYSHEFYDSWLGSHDLKNMEIMPTLGSCHARYRPATFGLWWHRLCESNGTHPPFWTNMTLSSFLTFTQYSSTAHGFWFTYFSWNFKWKFAVSLFLGWRNFQSLVWNTFGLILRMSNCQKSLILIFELFWHYFGQRTCLSKCMF